MCVNLSVPEAPRSYNGLVAGNRKRRSINSPSFKISKILGNKISLHLQCGTQVCSLSVKVVAVAYDRFLIIGL